MNGAESTKGFVLVEMSDRIKDIETNGGSFCKITRERTDCNTKNIDLALTKFTEFGRYMQNMTIAVLLLALSTGGNLVYSILKTFKIIP